MAHKGHHLALLAALLALLTVPAPASYLLVSQVKGASLWFVGHATVGFRKRHFCHLLHTSIPILDFRKPPCRSQLPSLQQRKDKMMVIHPLATQ
jgi:hypothetical protein